MKCEGSAKHRSAKKQKKTHSKGSHHGAAFAQNQPNAQLSTAPSIKKRGRPKSQSIELNRKYFCPIKPKTTSVPSVTTISIDHKEPFQVSSNAFAAGPLGLLVEAATSIAAASSGSRDSKTTMVQKFVKTEVVAPKTVNITQIITPSPSSGAMNVANNANQKMETSLPVYPTSFFWPTANAQTTSPIDSMYYIINQNICLHVALNESFQKIKSLEEEQQKHEEERKRLEEKIKLLSSKVKEFPQELNQSRDASDAGKTALQASPLSIAQADSPSRHPKAA